MCVANSLEFMHDKFLGKSYSFSPKIHFNLCYFTDVSGSEAAWSSRDLHVVKVL